MNEEVRLSDESRKTLEKQLRLLSEQNERHATGHTAAAILELVKVLEMDNQLRERDARLKEYFEYECNRSKEREAAEQRERELEEEQRRERKKRIRFTLRVLEITLVCSLLVSLLVWLVL